MIVEEDRIEGDLIMPNEDVTLTKDWVVIEGRIEAKSVTAEGSLKAKSIVCKDIEVKKLLFVTGDIRSGSIKAGDIYTEGSIYACAVNSDFDIIAKSIFTLGEVRAERAIKVQEDIIAGSIIAEEIEACGTIESILGPIKSSKHIKGKYIASAKEINAGWGIEAEFISSKGYKIFAGLSAKKDEIELQKIKTKEIKSEIGHGILEIIP